MKEDRKDKALREHVLYLLDGGGAHVKFDEVIADIPASVRGRKPAGLPHSLWMLLEHLRMAQWDILEFSRNPKHVSPKWPEGYWPKTDAPPSSTCVEYKYQEVPARPQGDAGSGERSQDRSLRSYPMGRRSDYPARGPAGGRSQRLSSGADVGRTPSIGSLAGEIKSKSPRIRVDFAGMAVHPALVIFTFRTDRFLNTTRTPSRQRSSIPSSTQSISGEM